MKMPKIRKTAGKKLAAPKAARHIASATVHDPMEYALPGGVALGACLLAASGILFRKPLKALVSLAATTAMHEGATAMKMLEGRRLLEAVGARRRRPSIGTIAGVGLGALGVMAAASALTIWLAPKRAIPSLGHRNGAIPESMSDSFESATAASSHS